MGNNGGWIKLYRSVMDTPEWLTEPFTRGQAWVDLLLLANHETGFIRRRGVLVAVERGQVGYSEESLAARWRWSRGKVRRFLSELTGRSWISRGFSEKTVQKKASVNSVIHIVNYDKRQANGTEDGTEESRKMVPEQGMKRIKEYTPAFLEFYEAYPKKAGRDEAWKAWQKRARDKELPPLETILKAIEDQKAWRANAAPGDFRPEWKDPVRWIKYGCWADETETKSPPPRREEPQEVIVVACLSCGVPHPSIDLEGGVCFRCSEGKEAAHA